MSSTFGKSSNICVGNLVSDPVECYQSINGAQCPLLYRGQLFMPALLGEFYFPHIELPNSVDRPAIVDYSWCLPLCFGQDYVYKVFACWYHFDGLEVV